MSKISKPQANYKENKKRTNRRWHLGDTQHAEQKHYGKVDKPLRRF